ncbi:MAG: hypothetical protein J0I98_02965 [Mesorhizobium sp.]|nr:hypothetical protein [Mesorhizobium sp.]MBN9241736.1 hypothetical protein [Mesorhizobium sp.]
MAIVRGSFFGLIGLVFGMFAMFALIPALAAFRTTDSPMPGWAWAIPVIGLLLGIFAPTVRRAFGRGFLMLGASVFALPLSAMLLSGRVSSDMVAGAAQDDKAVTAIGSGIAGFLVTGAATFVGFFFGAILLVVGLVLALGGRREVVVVHQPIASRADPQL